MTEPLWDVEGWKGVADVLNRSIATVRRYEWDGLPVRRIHGRIVARHRELLSWWEGFAS